MGQGWWELIFLMLLMKIPIVYLCAVVWWAVKSEPRHEEGAAVVAALDPELPPKRFFGRFRSRPRGPRPGPHGGPVRRPERVASAAARAQGPRS